MKEGSGGITIMIFVIIIIIILILEGDKIKPRTREGKETMCQGFHLLLKYQYLLWVIIGISLLDLMVAFC